jgi:molybdopterin-guanine dinucleotide biosynthesis protein A
MRNGLARVTPITTVVLAGGPADDVSALQPGLPNKAFVRIGDATLVERTIRALRASSEVGRIIAVAPLAAHHNPALAGANDLRPDGIKIRESLHSGLNALPPDELVLIAASDLPILTPEAVSDFVRRARECDPDIGYGCLERAAHVARFPEVPHTWAHLREGTFCGGGLMVMKPRALPVLETFIERLGAARKNPLALAALFGRRMLLKFALRRLHLAEAEARASVLVGAPVRAIVSPFAETAVNVDRVTDVALAERLVTPANASA